MPPQPAGRVEPTLRQIWTLGKGVSDGEDAGMGLKMRSSLYLRGERSLFALRHVSFIVDLDLRLAGQIPA